MFMSIRIYLRYSTYLTEDLRSSLSPRLLLGPSFPRGILRKEYVEGDVGRPLIG